MPFWAGFNAGPEALSGTVVVALVIGVGHVDHLAHGDQVGFSIAEKSQATAAEAGQHAFLGDFHFKFVGTHLAFREHVGNLGSDRDDLEDRGASVIPGVPAFRTTAGAGHVNGDGRPAVIEAEGFSIKFLHSAGRLLAIRAEQLDEPLGTGGLERLCDFPPLESELFETLDDLRGARGVNRGEHLVTRHGRLDGEFRGLDVPDFSHQDDIRVGAHERSNHRLELLGALQVAVGDAGNLVFHRVFQREDVDVRAVEFPQDGVERGGLAGSGRAGHDDDAGGDLHHLVQREHGLVIEGERALAKRHVDVALVEQTHRDVVAPIGPVALITDVDGPMEIGNRETSGNPGSRVPDLGGQFHQVEQEGVQAVLQFHRNVHLGTDVSIAAERIVKRLLLHLEVHVGRAGPDGVRHDGGDELRHRLGIVGGDVEVMDPVVHVLHVDGFKIGSARTVVGGHRFDGPADFRGKRDDLDDFQMREPRGQIFLGQRAPWIRDGNDQFVRSGQAERGEKPASHHGRVAGRVERAVTELGDFREKRQAVDLRQGRHETVAGDTVRDLVLRELRITGIVRTQLAHDAAADEFVEGDAVEFDHSSKCFRVRNVQLSYSSRAMVTNGRIPKRL